MILDPERVLKSILIGAVNIRPFNHSCDDAEKEARRCIYDAGARDLALRIIDDLALHISAEDWQKVELHHRTAILDESPMEHSYGKSVTTRPA